MPKLSSSAVLSSVLSGAVYKIEVASRMAEGAFNIGKSIYKLEPDKTSKEYLNGLKDAMNPKLWKRDSKQKLYVHDPLDPEPFDEIGIWDNGEINDMLKTKALQDWTNSGRNKKFLPVERQFIMSKYMGGDYMMKVWTTYDDMQIIGWAVNAD